jgi:hypothetical protein
MFKIHLLKLIVVTIFLLTTTNLFAHVGGHYHNGDGTVFNTWQLADGKLVSGNFTMGNAVYIVLEQNEGKLIKLPIKSLTPQAQKLALFKIKQYNEINADFMQNQDLEIKTVWHYGNMLVLVLLILVITHLIYYTITRWQTTKRLASVYLSLPVIALLVFACKKTTETIATTTTTTTVIPTTRTSFLDSAFATYKPAVSTNSDATYYYVSSNGVPSHNMMVGITSWQQQVPIPQFYTGTNSWSIPLQPVYASTPLSTKYNLMSGAVALAVNGIPIFNALNNRGEDSYAIGELDNWGGHCGKADDYHYHAAPLHLSAVASLPIAFALDGFAVYGSKEPDGSTLQALDTCHGHVVNNGVYHYHGTTTYPYVVGAMKGKVSISPNSVAPENFIIPQASSSPLRPATTPLNGASITAFTSTGTNAYKLTYLIGGKPGYVEYSWDASNKYTYKLTDTSGKVTTTTYQR